MIENLEELGELNTAQVALKQVGRCGCGHVETHTHAASQQLLLRVPRFQDRRPLVCLMGCRRCRSAGHPAAARARVSSRQSLKKLGRAGNGPPTVFHLDEGINSFFPAEKLPNSGSCLAATTTRRIFYPAYRKFVPHGIRTPAAEVPPEAIDQLV